MVKAKKTETVAPEDVQEGQEPQGVSQDIQAEEPTQGTAEIMQEPETAAETAEGGQGVPTEDLSEEPRAVVFTEYAVVGCERLNLREEPRLDAPVVAELPCGVGVSGNGRPAQDGWRLVFTGRLFGWVMDEYLEPIVLSHASE